MRNRTVSLVAVTGLVAAVAAGWWMNRAPAPLAGPVADVAAAPRAAGGSAGAPDGAAAPGAATDGKATSAQAAKGAPGAGGGGGGGARGPSPVEVVEVAASRVQDDLQTVGSLRSNESVVMRSEVAGRISAIGFRDGQPVRRGQLLVGLDASVNEAEVAQARAELALARSNLQRTEDLARRNFVSSSAQEQAASTVQVLEAKLQLAEARLQKTRIVAPFNGVVGIRSFSTGDYVKDGADLVNVEDVSRLKADFRLPERALARIKVGQEVEVAADALPDARVRGTIDAINPRVDSNGRSLELRAVLPNADGRLRPGMFVRVRVIVGERSDAVVVPEEAIVPAGSEFFVFRVVDDKAMRVKVVPGVRRDGKVEIGSGLAVGDKVVVAGQVRLGGDAQPVRVVPTLGAAAPVGTARAVAGS